MKLNLGERFIVNNPLRAFIQRRIEGPMLKRMAGLESYPLCLEIGCGRGVGAEIIVEQFGAQSVVATDVDTEQIERAKKTLNPNLRIRLSSGLPIQWLLMNRITSLMLFFLSALYITWRIGERQ